MIRRAISILLALGLTASAVGEEQRTFYRSYDLSVPTISATTNRIVTVVNLTNTTFTIANQPDVPRNITITVVDTTPTITAGTITVTGVDVNGATITEVLDMAGPTLTFTGTKVFETITSVVAADAVTLDGAGDETIIVGVGSVVSYIYCSLSEPIVGRGRVTTSGSSTTVTTVGSELGFGGIGAGDELLVSTDGATVARRIVDARSSATSLTVTSAVNWENSGTGFSWQWRDRICDYDDTAGWWATTGLADVNVKVENGDGSGTALTATGGLDVSFECRLGKEATLPSQVLAVNMTATLRPTFSDVFPILENCSAVRVGIKWGTVDTSGTDSVSAYLVGDRK